ncbi:SDR family oxidoreductase [Streptomyces peucetius]|uniref:SDR family oxidoreductase n=1 Tax=Streptomyces peucetius TaxID=1950 RepID=A0ABY6I2U6_STRPE|nr:SDR family oxidoreductase [Streptomyces peucetius]UYQ60070.1 SDR family oxidoreductase [Streptomyces peucetius]
MAASCPDNHCRALRGRVAVITGANSGLGRAIVRYLVECDVHVIMACRDIPAAQAVRGEVLKSASPAAAVEIVPCDLASLYSVGEAAEQIATRGQGVDLLVNNAGVMAVDAGLTEDGFETQFGVNYLGHFALTAGLLPLLRQRPEARIVMAASNGHRLGRLDLKDPMFTARRYNRWAAYFQSKLALQLFTLELSRRLAASSSGVTALSANPGAARTDLGWEGHSMSNVLNRFVSYTFPSTSHAIRPMLRALTDPRAGQNDLFGPRLRVLGAPVRERPSRRARDLATARRLWDLSIELTGRDPGLPACSAAVRDEDARPEERWPG